MPDLLRPQSQTPKHCGRIASNVSFFKTGRQKDFQYIAVAKSSLTSSTIKVYYFSPGAGDGSSPMDQIMTRFKHGQHYDRRFQVFQVIHYLSFFYLVRKKSIRTSSHLNNKLFFIKFMIGNPFPG
jgi:hypothetical protein